MHVCTVYAYLAKGNTCKLYTQNYIQYTVYNQKIPPVNFITFLIFTINIHNKFHFI